MAGKRRNNLTEARRTMAPRSAMIISPASSETSLSSLARANSDQHQEWRVVIKMTDPIPVMAGEIDVIETYFAELLDEIFAAGRK